MLSIGYIIVIISVSLCLMVPKILKNVFIKEKDYISPKEYKELDIKNKGILLQIINGIISLLFLVGILIMFILFSYMILNILTSIITGEQFITERLYILLCGILMTILCSVVILSYIIEPIKSAIVLILVLFIWLFSISIECNNIKDEYKNFTNSLKVYSFSEEKITNENNVTVYINTSGEKYINFKLTSKSFDIPLEVFQDKVGSENQFLISVKEKYVGIEAENTKYIKLSEEKPIIFLIEEISILDEKFSDYIKYDDEYIIGEQDEKKIINELQDSIEKYKNYNINEIIFYNKWADDNMKFIITDKYNVKDKKIEPLN